MTPYTDLVGTFGHDRLTPWLQDVQQQLPALFATDRHGDLQRWLAVLEALPVITPGIVELKERVVIGGIADCPAETRAALEGLLRQLHPWRKGPFDVFGIHVDTEWRSDWKWDRLKVHIQPLEGRLVLDVGCGNGYHCLRSHGAGARAILGIDPTYVFVMQFLALRHYLPKAPVAVLPLGIDDVPPALHAFDTVFSMGVLYHRRSPLDHLLQLRDCLRSGGELVLETLVVEGDAATVLLPEDRYARMRNVWFLPSCAQLELWLRRCGFRDVRIVDVTRTTAQEQRSTDWMRFESLPDCLKPGNTMLTVEGYPAPTRAIAIATAP